MPHGGQPLGKKRSLAYYVRRTVRDEDIGQVRTETCVFDTPQQATGTASLPAPAKTGEADDGMAETFPKEKQEPGGRTHPLRRGGFGRRAAPWGGRRERLGTSPPLPPHQWTQGAEAR